MDPGEETGRADAALPRGPHPTIGPATVSMPRWPGPLLVVGGALLAVGALVATALERGIDIESATLAWLAVIGAVAFALGLVYSAVRQLRVRRFLAPERYRGPSVLILLALVLVIASVLTAPFGDDAATLLLGAGELSLAGAIVLLVATQAALLLVSWLFVFRPKALAALPSFPGPDAARALRLGLGWGVVAWIGASVVS